MWTATVATVEIWFEKSLKVTFAEAQYREESVLYFVDVRGWDQKSAIGLQPLIA
jgi:hypothetical protein